MDALPPRLYRAALSRLGFFVVKETRNPPAVIAAFSAVSDASEFVNNREYEGERDLAIYCWGMEDE